MSKVKKILCFVLALAMVFALAIPAFAEGIGDGEASAYTVWVHCPNCGGSTARFDYTESKWTGATRNHNGHTDMQKHSVDWYICSVCGRYSMNDRYVWVCP